LSTEYKVFTVFNKYSQNLSDANFSGMGPHFRHIYKRGSPLKTVRKTVD